MLTIFKKISLLLLLITTILSSVPMNVHAQPFVPTAVVVESSPTAIKRTVDTTMLQVKNYVLDGLAWAVAKIMLQQITASVVNWINSGFDGSPAFLTNPGAFFADTADQITGAFIANSSELSRLCSPFSIDIRLGLALYGGAGYNASRYTCTLSTVINNMKRSSVNVNGRVSVNGSTVAAGGVSADGTNGASIDGFLNGDFNQGGWPAFMVMTTEPQNNLYGAFLKAKSDLDYQIATRQNNIRLDLQMGRGFMSWQKCNDVNMDDLDTYNYDLGIDTTTLERSNGGSLSTGSNYYSGAPTSLVKKVDGNGKATYQNCETQTPGSVIAGSIDKSLGIPQDTLNIAGSLNQIVGALFAQLVSKVLSGGLHASSNYSYSGSASAGVAAQLLQQHTDEQLGGTRNQLNASLGTYAQGAVGYMNVRKQAVDVLGAAKTAYQTASACLAGKLPANIVNGSDDNDYAYLQSQISNINIAVAKVDAAMSEYQSKLADADSRIETINRLQAKIGSAQTTDQINAAAADFSTALQGGLGTGALVSQTDMTAAQDDLKTAQARAQQFSANAEQFQNACNVFKPSSGGYDGWRYGDR